MSYSVNQLITNAFYLSKVRSKDFQDVGGDDITVGLDIFNKVLNGMNFNQKMIPYYKEYVTTAVIGQEMYFIPQLVLPLSLTFNMTTVRFATSTISRREYHSTTRIDGIIALPFTNTFERCLNGSNLFVQFLPADTYVFKIWGKFGLDSVTVADLPTDLLATYELTYIDYLEMLTAKRICAYYGVAVNPDVQFFLDELSSNVNDMNVIDLTSQKINFYSDKTQLNWAEMNLSHGFTPASW